MRSAAPPPRGKKMTRPVSRGISSNARTISASRRPSTRVVGTAAHIPASSWRRNSSISACSSSATSTSPSAMSCSPKPGRMRRNFIAAIIPQRRRAVRSARGRHPLVRPEDVDRARPAAEPAQPVADRLGAIARAARAASSGARPSARCAASAEECVQPEPCAAPSGWRSPGISWIASPSKSDVGRLVPVPARDHDHVRPERVQRAGELLGVARRRRRRRARAPRAGWG